MLHFGWSEVICRPLSRYVQGLEKNLIKIEFHNFKYSVGIEPPTDKKIWIERKTPLTDEEKNEPIDRPFQYSGEQTINIIP